MNTSLDRTVTWIAFAGAALLLGACNTTEPGVDDFQNAQVDAATAGRSLAGSFATGKDWDAAVSAPVAPAFAFPTQTAVLRKSTALPKRAAGLDFVIDLDDTAKGHATLTLRNENALFTSWDTVTVKWDDQARDDVKDNENIIRYKHVKTHALGGKVETLVISDGDGNGVVTPAAGVDDKAKFQFTTAADGVVETAELVVGAGPDDDFDAEGDNFVEKAVWTRVKAGEVIAQGEFLDGDGDGYVGNNARTSIAIAKWFELEPAGKPWVAKHTAEARIRVFADKAGDEPVSFAFTEELKTGRVNTLSLRNRDGGTDIVKDDTLWVTLKTVKTAGDDTLKQAELVFVMNPGSDLKSDADDLCYAIHVKTEKRRGFERAAEFHFVAGEPVPHGQEPKSGTFSGKATYANGQTATLAGSFSPGRFTAEYTGPDGNTVKVEFAKDGAVI